MLSHHPLVKEFPEHKETIHDLKMKDKHFLNIMNKYEELDKKIFAIESKDILMSDFDLESLKKERLSLKDELYVSILKVK